MTWFDNNRADLPARGDGKILQSSASLHKTPVMHTPESLGRVATPKFPNGIDPPLNFGKLCCNFLFKFYAQKVLFKVPKYTT